MDIAEGLITLTAAALGAAAGLLTTAWSFRQATREARQERRSAEESTLRALLMEIRLVGELTDEASPSSLPTDVLVLALASVHHMTVDQQRALIAYAQAVRRYNGRVVRLVAYGVGKRAAGGTPGAEAPIEHAEIVNAAIPEALAAVEAHLSSDRFRMPATSRRPGGALQRLTRHLTHDAVAH